MVGSESSGVDTVKRARCYGPDVRAVLPALGLVLAAGAVGSAQEPGPEDGRAGAVLSESARVSLVTIVPGKKVYSLFGHNALRVFDPERGIDIAYNYGTFDFGNPLVFSARFAYGDLNYRLTRQSYERMVAFYPVEEGRPVIEQHLDLDAEQREEIFRFLEWNSQPENAYYRYDFYYDNCATRIRDVLEEVLGQELVVGSPDPGGTMRQLLDPYLVEKSWLHFGMDVGQGLPADAGATLANGAVPSRPARVVGRGGPGRERRPGPARSSRARTASGGPRTGSPSTPRGTGRSSPSRRSWPSWPGSPCSISGRDGGGGRGSTSRSSDCSGWPACWSSSCGSFRCTRSRSGTSTCCGPCRRTSSLRGR